MENDKKKKSNLLTKIAVGALVLYLVAMFGVIVYKDIIYKDYKTIHSEIDPDMPGYEIPIAKNVELANNRVSDGIAYRKYDYTPDEYAKLVEELEEDEEKAEEDKVCFNNHFYHTAQECGLGYELSYDIISAERIEVEQADRDNGVTDMYAVEFQITISRENEKDLRSESYEHKIAKVDDTWIFYEQGFSVPGQFLSFYTPIDIDVE